MNKEHLFFYTTNFYVDDPTIVQSAICGVIIDKKFTGTVEHGGKYARVYYFVDDVDISNLYDGDDEREWAVFNAVEGLESYYKDNFNIHWEFNHNTGQPEKKQEFVTDNKESYCSDETKLSEIEEVLSH